MQEMGKKNYGTGKQLINGQKNFLSSSPNT